jgi:ubiquinol oxidase
MLNLPWDISIKLIGSSMSIKRQKYVRTNGATAEPRGTTPETSNFTCLASPKKKLSRELDGKHVNIDINNGSNKDGSTADGSAEGPITLALLDRPPFGPMERLDPAKLLEEQKRTLQSKRRLPSRSAKVLFVAMDLFYGKRRTLEKFRVLELVARVPYQAWENVAYIALTHTARRPGFARRVFDSVRANRWEQDNEQWHLLILEELTADSTSHGWARRQLVPQILAFTYYWLSWFLYAIRPAWSYRLNADFEDHAEHEYALVVQENPSWETTPFRSDFADDFGHYYSTLAELFRQIAYDERLHKLQSEAMLARPRFH